MHGRLIGCLKLQDTINCTRITTFHIKRNTYAYTSICDRHFAERRTLWCDAIQPAALGITTLPLCNIRGWFVQTREERPTAPC